MKSPQQKSTKQSILLIAIIIIVITFIIGVFLPHIHHHQRHHNEYPFFGVTFAKWFWRLWLKCHMKKQHMHILKIIPILSHHHRIGERRIIIAIIIIIIIFIIGVFSSHSHHHRQHHNEFRFLGVTFLEMSLKGMVEVSHEGTAHKSNDLFSFCP